MRSPPSSSSSGPRRSVAFARLHERVRRWIWQQHWVELRDIQEAAIDAILAGTGDVLIMAATAGGKSEAAFLPICSTLVGAATGSVRALAISPVKALINDQFERLERLCESLDIAVHRWHGDVAAVQKTDLVADPRGLLLITPESLEALCVLHGPQLPRLFAALAYVVIDEVHAFLGSARGRQVQSLLHRLETRLERPVPRIALSATLGDPRGAADFVRPGHGAAVQLIQSTAGAQELKLQLRGYRITAPVPNTAATRAAPPHEDAAARAAPVTAARLAIRDHLFTTLRGRDHLIFANTRAAVEQYADLLRDQSERHHVPNEFFPHHGNLSPALRAAVEARLKDPQRPLTAVCTATLELGIDLGTIQSIAQIGAAPSVTSLRQRLGRSGRRPGEPAILRQYITAPTLTATTAPQDTLHPELVQSIAMVHLLAAAWYEPPATGALHLSTLVQQVLSLIAERGGVSARGAWQVLCHTGPFAGVDPAMFATLLRALGTHDLLDQARDGALVLGGVGERLVNHYRFYTVFTTPAEYRLVSAGRTLGRVPLRCPLAKGAVLIFAGRRWEAVAVDARRRVVELVPAPGGRPPIFGGTGLLLHDTIRRAMFHVYRSAELPPFLDATARELLTEARSHFARLRLGTRRLIAHGRGTLLFCWAGDRVLHTIVLQLRAAGCAATHEGLAISVSGCRPGMLRTVLQALVAAGVADGRALARGVANPCAETYDRYLPDELRTTAYAAGHLDPVGAWSALRDVLTVPARTPGAAAPGREP